MKKSYNGSLSVWNIEEKDFPRNGKLVNKIKFLLNYGILAPSGHNSQPWKFIVEGRELIIVPDFERRRRTVDPEDRELFISLGCAVKNIEVAAKYFGMIFEKKYEINEALGRARIIFKFKEGVVSSTCKNEFEAILERRTYRGDFKLKKIEKKDVDKLLRISTKKQLIELWPINNRIIKSKLAELVYRSNKIWYRSKKLVEELEAWLADDAYGLQGGIPTGMLNMYKVAVNLKILFTDDSKSDDQKAVVEMQKMLKAPLALVILSKTDSIENWIESGEMYEELALKAKTMDLDVGFFNATIELKKQRDKLAKIIETMKKPQLLIRVGRAKQIVEHTTRRGVGEVIISNH